MCSKIVTQFNEVLESFLDQLSPTIGTKYANKFRFYVSMDTTMAIEKFLVHALPVREKILKRDDTYFTSSECTGNTTDNNIMTEIIQMQTIYHKLDNESKKNLWDIFQALLLLGEEYIKVTRLKNL
jgi:hypothetical protein